MNYRPGSLTCITCKLFEHIFCNHILAHLEDHTILTDLQHGSKSGRPWEIQLVTTFQDLAQMHNKKGSQIDIVDGKQSSRNDVVSDVPQGTVLGPLLLLLHINDLPLVVSSRVRLFAEILKIKKTKLHYKKTYICLRTGVTHGVCVLTLPSAILTLSNDLEWSKHTATMTNKRLNPSFRFCVTT